MSSGKVASITDVSFTLPSWGEIVGVLTLQSGFNSAIVVIGTTLLGVAAGLIGSFALLRKRALMGDALAHCAFPGLGLAFIAAVFFGFEGRSLGWLLSGAALSGVLGVITVQFLITRTRIREDAAIGAVLSIFFGAGVVLMSYIQGLGTGSEGGLHHFIYGQTAAMHSSDALLIGGTALFVSIVIFLLVKEFQLVCFDSEYAATLGWNINRVDLLMMSLVVLVTVVGLQAVGIILIVALLIVPATAARFWTERLSLMLPLSAIFGGLSGYIGSSASALLPRFPAGAVIVLSAGAIFLLSFLMAPARGLIASFIRRDRLKLKIAEDHVLRTLFEMRELASAQTLKIKDIPDRLGVSGFTLYRLIKRMLRAKNVALMENTLSLTEKGFIKAQRLTRNHRLWEEYLLQHADIAVSHLDYSADRVEHVLSPKIIEHLEEALALRGSPSYGEQPPQSLHDIAALKGPVRS